MFLLVLLCVVAVQAHLPAYVLSVNPIRWERSKAYLTSLGLEPIPWPAVPLTDPEIVARFPMDVSLSTRKIYSNLLSQLRLWQFIGSHHISGWVLFFEDDAILHPSIATRDRFQDMLSTALLQGGEEGFVYLGICGPQWQSRPEKAIGRCVHAYAVDVTRAQTLETKLGINKKTGDVFLDVQMEQGWSKYGGAHVAGAHLVSPDDASWWGLFYQNRKEFPPEIYTN